MCDELKPCIVIQQLIEFIKNEPDLTYIEHKYLKMFRECRNWGLVQKEWEKRHEQDAES